MRLCIYAILNLVPQGLALFAPCCASWGAPNRGTSMRSMINPHGHEPHPSVSSSNACVSRTHGCTLLMGRAHGETGSRLLLIMIVPVYEDGASSDAPTVHEYVLPGGTAGSKLTLSASAVATIGKPRFLRDQGCIQATSHCQPRPSTNPCLCPGIFHRLLDAVAGRKLTKKDTDGQQHENHRPPG